MKLGREKGEEQGWIEDVIDGKLALHDGVPVLKHNFTLLHSHSSFVGFSRAGK